ncbi:hypothetical protein [Acinetobacter junii]|uniref:hypothetical protein n=1 Tax=Acinetobacter TaxID=469 RepID=UPI0032155902
MPQFILNLSYKKLIFITGISALVVCGLIFLFQKVFNETFANVLTNVLVALSASICVSFFWNKFILDATDHYEKSGIKDYTNDFSDIEVQLRKGLKEAQKIEIFFMHGHNFIHSNSSSLKDALSKRGNEITLMIADENNPFLEKYAQFWGYDNHKIPRYIDETMNLIIGWHKDLPEDNRAKFELYKFTKGCFSYSYYKLNKDIYFVPNKLVAEKTFKPITIYASETKSETCLYNRIEREKTYMMNSGELTKVYPLG